MSHNTTNVIVTRTGTGWTVDVTACALNSDTTQKDFLVFHNGTLTTNADYTKTTATLLTYGGPALAASTVVEIHRYTADGPIVVVGYADRLASADYNAELERIHRILAESRLNGIGGTGSIAVTLDNGAYSVGTWGPDTIKGATRAALSAKFEATDAVISTKAPLASPALTGTPTAPTATAGNSSAQLANTGWAQGEFLNKTSGGTVTGGIAFQGATTAITQTQGDNSTKLGTTAYVDTGLALKANSASPGLTGTPTAPTAAVDTNTTQIATTAYVVGQAGAANPIINGTATPGASLRYSRQDHVHPTDTTRAPLASPGLTGTPTAPTAAPNTNSTQIATTAYTDTGLALKSNIASPTFTGIPAAPTAAVNTNTTQLATTAYVVGQAASVSPIAMAPTAVTGTSLRYAREDHVHPSFNNTRVSAYLAATAQSANTNISLTEESDANNLMASGVYTAPSTGLYQVSFSGLANIATSFFVRNSTVPFNTQGVTCQANTTVAASWLMSLTANDTIALQVGAISTVTVYTLNIVRLA